MSPRSISVVRASLVFPLSVVVPTLIATLGTACSSTSNTVVDGGAGIVQGEADNHCIGMAIPASQASCHATANPDAGASSGDGGAMQEVPVHFGSESDDDDCKAHASFT